MNIMSVLASILWIIPCIFILIIGQWGLIQVNTAEYSFVSLVTNGITFVAVLVASWLCLWTRNTFAKKDDNNKAWLFIGIGALVWSIGQLILTISESFPNWVLVTSNDLLIQDLYDLFYVASIPIFIIAFYFLAKSLKTKIPVYSWIIGIVVFVGAVVLSYFTNWGLLFPPQGSELLTPDRFIFTSLYAVLYPILLAYASLIASILFTGIMGKPWIYVVIGFIVYSGIEIAWNLIDSIGLYTVGSYWDILWIVGFGFIAIGAIENYYLFKKSYY